MKVTEFLQDESFLNLNIISFRISKLIEIQRKNIGINDIEKTVETMTPKIFWKEKPIIIQQLRKWTMKNLLSISNDLANTEILMKKNSEIKNEILIKKLLVNTIEKAVNS